MDDDDDFGDLYSDILIPTAGAAAGGGGGPPPPPADAGGTAPIAALLDDDEDDDLILYGAPPQDRALDPPPAAAGDWLLAADPAPVEADAGARAPDAPPAAAPYEEDKIDIDIEIGEPYEEPEIPGLSVGPRPAAPDDWDSDSEDDLKIVLNETEPVRRERLGDDDDEDGEEDFIIVADEQPPMIHQEQDWGEEAAPAAADGKEAAEAGKVNGSVGNAAGARVAYGGGHGWNPQHQSMYKYIRPGAGPVPGGPVVGALGGPGQLRPPPPLGPAAGRGRGDWRPPGGRGIPNGPRNFNAGYGLPGWANNTSGRGFGGGGLDFTLPSHKTAFDIDIESFEEKPWRYPGVDTSDFFNFGLDEDNWKAYCKQLEQLRLEATMQSRIRVYEGGRSEQAYDPDMPPELAVASVAGQHDGPEIVHPGKIGSGQADLNGLGGAGGIQSQMPIGRAIQVEAGYGERLPSSEVKQSRFRDSDATIEIVLQGSLNDSSTCDGEQLEKELQGESKAFDDTEEESDAESDHVHLPHSLNDQRENPTRKGSSVPGDGTMSFLSDSPGQYHRNSKMRSPQNMVGASKAHRGGRLPKGTSRGCRQESPQIARRNYREHSIDTSRGRRQESPQIARRNYREHSIDGNSGQNAQVSRHDSPQVEERRGSVEGNQITEASPARAVSATRELSSEQRDSDYDDRLTLGDSIEIGEEVASESQDCPGDDSLDRSSKKQKLSSQVEQHAAQENGEKDALRATHSDNSRAKSGNSKDYQKRRDGGEEVLQGGHSRRTVESRKRHEERNARRRDDYGHDVKHEIDRNHTVSKGREALHHSYPHKDWDSSSAHHVRGRNEVFDRQREMGGGQRRDSAIHGRRVKDEDSRRERNEETGSKNRNKVKVGESNGKDDEIPLKRHMDDGDLRVRHREGSSRLRGRDDALMRRRENLDEPPTKRNKAEEYPRREKTDREDTLPVHRAREDSNRRKREKDDGADYRRREADTRTREKAEERHSIKPRDDNWRQREREERPRLKQSHKDPPTHREREDGRTTSRNGRTADDKLLAGNGKSKGVSKGMGSDKDNQTKDRRRQNEQFKKVDRTMDRNESQHRGREDAHSRKKQTSYEEENPQHEKMTAHSDRQLNASDSQQVHGEKHKEHPRNTRDIEANEHNSRSLGKREIEEDFHQKGKVSRKDSSEQVHNSIDENPENPQQSDPAGELGEDVPVSDDDSQKGRSKLERWTSHKERDMSDVVKIQSLASSSMVVESTNSEMVQTDESAKNEGTYVDDSESKFDAGLLADKMGEDQDRHDDTVAKLKKRSERFRLAVPVDKDLVPNRKVENEAQLIQNDAAAAAAADLEIKTERPTRKRRWTGS